MYKYHLRSVAFLRSSFTLRDLVHHRVLCDLCASRARHNYGICYSHLNPTSFIIIFTHTHTQSLQIGSILKTKTKGTINAEFFCFILFILSVIGVKEGEVCNLGGNLICCWVASGYKCCNGVWTNTAALEI